MTELKKTIVNAFLSKLLAKQWQTKYLKPGKSHRVELQIAGKVDGKPIEPLSVNGILSTGHPSTRSTNVTPKAAAIVAALLPSIPKTRRQKAFDAIAEQFKAEKAIKPSADDLETAQAFLKRLSIQKSSNVGAPVTANLS